MMSAIRHTSRRTIDAYRTTSGPLRMHRSADREMRPQLVLKQSFLRLIMTGVSFPTNGDEIAVHSVVVGIRLNWRQMGFYV